MAARQPGADSTSVARGNLRRDEGLEYSCYREDSITGKIVGYLIPDYCIILYNMNIPILRLYEGYPCDARGSALVVAPPYRQI